VARSVRTTAVVPETRGGKTVGRNEAGGLFAHELSHINGLAAGENDTDHTSGGAGEKRADEVQDRTLDELTSEDKSDDISDEQAEAAIDKTNKESEEAKKEQKRRKKHGK